MRKHLIFAALAAFGALIISSCEREKDIVVPSAQSGEVSLVMSGISTRSAEVAMPVQTNVYDLGVAKNGERYTLEEYVTEMGALTDDVAETRGTPVYTQNVISVFGNAFEGEIHGAGGRVAAPGSFEVFPLSGGKNCWRRELGFDPVRSHRDLAGAERFLSASLSLGV